MMPPPKTRRFGSILCHVDSSIQSAKRLRYAEALSRTCGGRVTAVAVAPDPGLIVAHARAVHADVVVLGTGARRGRRQARVDATVTAVLERFRGAVLIVPRRCRLPPGGWPSRNIAAAVGDGIRRREQITRAARMAERFGAWLSLMPSRPGATAASRPELILYPWTRAEREHVPEGDGVGAFVGAAAVPVLVMRVARPRRARLRGVTRAA